MAQVPTLPTEHRSTSLVTRTTNPLERSSRRLPNGRDTIFQNIVTRNFSTRSTRDSRPKRIFKRRRHGTTGKTRNRRLMFPWKPAGIANLHLISVYHRKRYDASERHEGGGVKKRIKRLIRWRDRSRYATRHSRKRFHDFFCDQLEKGNLVCNRKREKKITMIGGKKKKKKRKTLVVRSRCWKDITKGSLQCDDINYRGENFSRSLDTHSRIYFDFARGHVFDLFNLLLYSIFFSIIYIRCYTRDKTKINM